jgi:hypothetical protein
VLGWIDVIVMGASCFLFFTSMSASFLGLLVTPTKTVPNLITCGSALSAACTGVGVAVGVMVGVGVVLAVAVAVGVGEAVPVAVAVAVAVGVAVEVSVGDAVAVPVAVEVVVGVALGVGVGVAPVGAAVGVAVGVGVGEGETAVYCSLVPSAPPLLLPSITYSCELTTLPVVALRAVGIEVRSVHVSLGGS